MTTNPAPTTAIAPDPPLAPPAPAVSGPDRLDAGIERAAQWLHDHQRDAGFWVGMLESNSCMEAQWVLCQHVIGVEEDPKMPGVLQCILNEQHDDGSWRVYHDAPKGDINTTVECYAALRSQGYAPDDEPLRKAREWILREGGLTGVRNFTKYWLALVGEWPWEHTPTLPPEIVYLPSWAPFNIYQFASWARATILPLAILSARRFTRPLPPDRRLDELYPDGRGRFDYNLPRHRGWASWEGFFHVVDRFLRSYVKFPVRPGREHAVRLCLEWIIKHQEADGAWSGIQPPWIYSLMALRCEGYALDHPVVHAGLDAFNHHWSYQRHGGTYLQASESPVWDTVLAMLALMDCGHTVTDNPALQRSLRWLLDEQVHAGGDWQVYVRNAQPGGWSFESQNDAYPDVDDTAVALIVLAKLRDDLDGPLRGEVDRAIERGSQWMLAMQCRNGGWAAFDKDNTKKLLTKIPFCDFGELLDPPSVDVTAHVIEALAVLGRTKDDPAVARALAYIYREQEAEGPWFGRWGVNYIYGTAAVLPALRAIGEDMTQPRLRRAADWIVSKQNADGGWGETAASYMDDSFRGVGPSTASQTGWALLSLLAVARPDHDAAVRRGVDYLLANQADPGTWDEAAYTGTGFPGYGVGERITLDENTGKLLGQGTELARAFMINYNLYRHYFPLMALGRARDHLANAGGS